MPRSRSTYRPWPLPAGPWRWRQRWCDLLFAHWPVPAAALRPLVPPELDVGTFEGTSWVGVVPFRMEGVMRRPLPDLPWISAFPELNLRLYVSHGGKPGVWFLSLDAGNPLAVWVARTFFHLPYLRARLALSAAGTEIHHRSERLAAPLELRFEARYRPTSEPYRAEPGSLEHALTERYCLYARSPRGDLYRATTSTTAPGPAAGRGRDHDQRAEPRPATSSAVIEAVATSPRLTALVVTEKTPHR